MGNIDLIIILTTAFLGSVGHCIGMCGGIVVAYSSAKIDPRSNYIQQTISHLAYNFGRVTTYAMLGALFGFIGQVVAFTPTTKGILFVFTVIGLTCICCSSPNSILLSPPKAAVV